MLMWATRCAPPATSSTAALATKLQGYKKTTTQGGCSVRTQVSRSWTESCETLSKKQLCDVVGVGGGGGGGYLTMSGGEGILDNVGNTGECVLLGSGWGLFLFVCFCFVLFVLFCFVFVFCLVMSSSLSSFFLLVLRVRRARETRHWSWRGRLEQCPLCPAACPPLAYHLSGGPLALSQPAFQLLGGVVGGGGRWGRPRHPASHGRRSIGPAALLPLPHALLPGKLVEDIRRHERRGGRRLRASPVLLRLRRVYLPRDFCELPPSPARGWGYQLLGCLLLGRLPLRRCCQGLHPRRML